MSNLDFQPAMQSPLHHFNLAAKAVPANDSQGVWANEMPLLAYISLRGNQQNATFMSAAKQALGIALPTQPCTLEHATWGYVCWLSPDEWLVICSRTQAAKLQAALEAFLDGIHSQVVDNSGGYTSVLLQGKNATDVLQHCTVYDLHALAANKIVGTTFGKASVFLHRQDFLHQHDKAYALILRRSFADYIWRYLARAAVPYGFGIAKL